VEDTTNEQQGIFINGRQQIIEMLQFMNEKEKNKLLNNIKLRNSVMAKELSEQSLSFNSLEQLSSAALVKIFSTSNPAIIGLALYNVSASFQKKVLSSMDRDQAEQAFTIMSKNLESKKHECKRAQEKLLQNAINLSRRQQISI
jgi:flagellar motor switch protein FliG